MAGDGSEEGWGLDVEGVSEKGGTLQTIENLSKRRECVLTVCRCCYSAAILLRTAVRRGMVERVQASALQIGSGQAWCVKFVWSFSRRLGKDRQIINQGNMYGSSLVCARYPLLRIRKMRWDVVGHKGCRKWS